MAPKGSKADAKPGKEEKVKAKRAPSPYILFCSEKRPEVKIKFPDASFGETGKILGQMWSQLSEKDKAVSDNTTYHISLNLHNVLTLFFPTQLTATIRSTMPNPRPRKQH